MKKVLCKFANWILRKCTEPMAFGGDVYINGRSYKLSKSTMEMSPYAHTIINFQVISGRK